MAPADLAKYDKSLWNRMEEEYCLTLERGPLEPHLFAQAERKVSTSHAIVVLKNYQQLEKLFENSEKSSKVEPIVERSLTTLNKYCDGHMVAISPLECVR